MALDFMGLLWIRGIGDSDLRAAIILDKRLSDEQAKW